MWSHQRRAMFTVMCPCFALACAAPTAVVEIQPMALPVAYESLSAADFPDVVEEVDASAARATSDREKATTHRLVARLHLHPQNPEPDVHAALEHLELSASLDPERGSCAEVQTWLVILRGAVGAIDERQEMQRQVAELEKRIRRLQARAAAVRATGDEARQTAEVLAAELEASRTEINSLRATIDELQRLDLRMERRRRSVRTSGGKAAPARPRPPVESRGSPGTASGAATSQHGEDGS